MRGGVVVLVALLMIPMEASAQAPALIPVEGLLTDSAGVALSGEHSITVALHSTEAGGESEFSETHQVMLDAGRFSIFLGDEESLELDLFVQNAQLYLSVSIDEGAELTPRMTIGTVPYAALAHHAQDSDRVGGRTASEFALASAAQSRVQDGCASGQAIRSIASDGAVTCESVSSGAGGDISGVAVELGLTGGGTQGDVTLGVDESYVQRRIDNACSSGQAIRAVASNGSIECVAVSSATGDITSVTAGNGLTGGGTQGDVTLTADETYMQRRVTGTCPTGQAVRQVGADGTVVCEDLPTFVHGGEAAAFPGAGPVRDALTSLISVPGTSPALLCTVNYRIIDGGGGEFTPLLYDELSAWSTPVRNHSATISATAPDQSDTVAMILLSGRDYKFGCRYEPATSPGTDPLHCRISWFCAPCNSGACLTF